MRRTTDEIEDDLKKLRKLLVKPRTIAEMMASAKVDRKTVYRWLARLEKQGVTLMRLGTARPTRYQALSDARAAQA